MILSGSKHILSVDPRDGSKHWMIEGPTEQFVASMVYDGERLFMAAGFPDYHVMAIRPDGTGDAQTGAYMDKDPEDVRWNFIRWLNAKPRTFRTPSVTAA